MQEYVLTLYSPYSKSRGWSLSPEQNGSTSKNNKSIRQNSLFFTGNNITETPQNTGSFECLILHNIILKSSSKTAKDEKSYTLNRIEITYHISSFVDTLLQPIAQKQQSFIKDRTDFISFIEKTKIGEDTILVSMDVSSLYTNIPQEEGTEIVCKTYDLFHNYKPPIPTCFLRQRLGLILNENSFQFNGENYLQTHGTAMGTKMAVSFANIFMAKIETTLIQQSKTKPKEWRRYIEDIFSRNIRERDYLPRHSGVQRKKIQK